MSTQYQNVWCEEPRQIASSLCDLCGSAQAADVAMLETAVTDLQLALRFSEQQIRDWPLATLAQAFICRDPDDRFWVAIDGLGYVTLVVFDETVRLDAEGWRFKRYDVTPLNALTDQAAVELAFRRIGDGACLGHDRDLGFSAALKAVARADWPANSGKEIYGSGGLHRYHLQKSGEVRYLARLGRDSADLARLLGFAVQ